MPLEIADDYSDSEFARRQTGLLFNLPVPPAGREQLPAGLSLCMIVKNEERFLADCLESVRDVVDEMCIVDTGSTDRTVEIARSFGATVALREWRNDFAWARNQALELATRRWVLVLDADEEIAPESLTLLRALRETPADETTVYVQIQNLVDDESGSGSTMTHILPRIFPTNPNLRYRGVIHENVVLEGAEYAPAVVSPIIIRHKGYTNAILDGRKKNERNKPLLARAVAEGQPDAFSWFNFGVAAIVAGDYAPGIEALERMFATPGTPRAFHGTAYAVLATGYAEGQGDTEKAIALLDTGLEHFPGHPNIIFMRGYFCASAGRYEEARTWYERAIEQRHDALRHFMVDDEIAIWKAPLNIAATYLKENRFEEAVTWYERARANKPESAMLREGTARVYELVGRFYDAERLWREGVEGNGVRGFIAHVNFLMRRRRFAEAFDAIDTRREAFSDQAYRLLLNSAAAASRDEALGDPEPFALRALELHRGDGHSLALLDSLYAWRGEGEKRARLRAAEMDAPLIDVADFARRSHRFLEAHRNEDALATARAGLDVAPGDGTLLYNAALAAARLRRDREALELLEAVPERHEHASSALWLRAEIERRAGDLDAAIATLEKLRALEAPESVIRQATVGLAAALIEIGRIADAAKIAALALA